MTRVSVTDLEIACEWLDTYDAAPDDPNGERCARVSAWLKEELARRKRQSLIRAGMRETGKGRREVAAALSRIAARKAANAKAGG